MTNLLIQKAARLVRVPGRWWRDLRLIRLLQNWREVLAAELTGAGLKRLQLRNGVILNGPNTLDLAFLFQEIWVKQLYTPPGYEIRRGDTVIDVGANIGVFATYAATRAPGVKVYSYEPFPENVSWLRRNLAESRLANVQVHQQAVAGSSGARLLRVSLTNWGVHRLAEQGIEGEGLQVSCVRLDEIINTNGVEQCALLKIDCEGGEYEILQNCAPDTLKRVRKIVIEYHEGPEHAGTGRELCRFLQSRSFRIDQFESAGVDSGYLSASSTVA